MSPAVTGSGWARARFSAGRCGSFGPDPVPDLPLGLFAEPRGGRPQTHPSAARGRLRNRPQRET